MVQTRNMLEIAYKEGIKHIIATPHYGVGCRNPDKEELHKKLEQVRTEAKKISESFQIDLGNELFFSDDILEELRKKRALTLAGTRYVLVEFAVSDEYPYIKTGIHRLLIHGYLPVLAHVERYECLYLNYAGINRLIELGAYMQMNISGISGKITDRKTGFCKKLLEYGLIHFIATDSHSDNMRAPQMREGLNYIKKKYGDDVVNQLLIENPSKLLKNKYI